MSRIGGFESVESRLAANENRKPNKHLSLLESPTLTPYPPAVVYPSYNMA